MEPTGRDDGVRGDEAEGLVGGSGRGVGPDEVDEQEALSIRKISRAVAALIGIAGFHYVINLVRGHFFTGSIHILVAMLFPTLFHQATKRRSTALTWLFHVLCVIFAFSYVVFFTFVAGALLRIEALDVGSDCHGMAQVCPDEIVEARFVADFSSDGYFWVCSDGLCIDSSRYCNGKMDCFDASDEWSCQTTYPQAATPEGPDSAELANDEKCMSLLVEQARLKKKTRDLRWWWYITVVPLFCLFLFAAYHSLELFVRLRLRGRAARLHVADAAILDSGALGLEEAGD